MKDEYCNECDGEGIVKFISYVPVEGDIEYDCYTCECSVEDCIEGVE